MKILLLLLLALGSLSAQVLEEKTPILVKPRGEALFSLERGESLYSYQPDEDGWYKVRKLAYLAPSALSGKTLSAGTVLYNKDEEKIGAILQPVKAEQIDTLEVFRGEDRPMVILEGYVFKTKIEDGSIPEQRVASILAMRNRNEQREAFAELWQEFDAEEREFDRLIAQVIREKNRHIQEEQDFRLIVLFRGSSIYAIISKDHEIEVGKTKAQVSEGPFTIYYFYKPTDSQKKLVEEQILYTFLAL